MKRIFTQLFAGFVLIAFTACSAGELNKKAEAVATDFYKNIQKKDYAAAVKLCSEKSFETDSKEAWSKGLQRNSILLGDIKTFTQTSGFNVATSTSVGTTVTVVYDVQWQYGKTMDSLILLKEKDGSMKIYSYRWIRNQANYLDEVGASEKQTIQYMDAIKTGDYDAAIALCSEGALKATPKEAWKDFFAKANDKYGPVTNYTLLREKSYYNIAAKGESGIGNYYDIYVKSQRGTSEPVTEKIVFFQKDYNEPVKLAGHFFQ